MENFVELFQAVLPVLANNGLVDPVDLNRLAMVKDLLRDAAFSNDVWRPLVRRECPDSNSPPFEEYAAQHGYRSLYWLLTGPSSVPMSVKKHRRLKMMATSLPPSCTWDDLTLFVKVFYRDERLGTFFYHGEKIKDVLLGKEEIHFDKDSFRLPKNIFGDSIRVEICMYRGSDRAFFTLSENKLSDRTVCGRLATPVPQEYYAIADDFHFQTKSVLGREIASRTHGAKIYVRAQAHLSGNPVCIISIYTFWRDEHHGCVSYCWCPEHGDEQGVGRFGVTLLHLLSEIAPSPPLELPSHFE